MKNRAKCRKRKNEIKWNGKMWEYKRKGVMTEKAVPWLIFCYLYRQNASKNEQRDPGISGVLFLWTEHAAVFLFCIGDCCCSRCLSRDKRYLWNGDCRMAECFCCSPFCGMWFFPLSPDDTGKVRMGVVKIRDLMPQKAGVSIGESLSEMSGRDNRNRNTFLQKWHGAGRTKEKQK